MRSLQAQFASLLALLGVAVVVNLGISVWSVGLLDREQRWANEQIGTVLGPLHEMNREVWLQSRLLGQAGMGWFDPPRTPAPDAGNAPGGPRAPAALDEFRRRSENARKALRTLEGFRSYALRSGVNTTRNLRERLRLAGESGEAWLVTGDELRRQQALRELYELHELIERLEARLIQDAQIASVYVGGVRTRLILTLLAAVFVVVVALVVAAWLFRRWVLLKAERLGHAAQRLGAGDFEHRIPIAGDDELDRVGQRLNDMAGTILAMQAERIERERLAAVGEMARRVAHNIRNPLAGIRSLAELSALEAPDSPVAEHQKRIIRTVDRFGAWLSELLSVSTPLEVAPRPEAVRPWLRDLIEALRPMGEHGQIELRLDDDAAPEEAFMDRRHLEHAVSAILTNAIEISPRGGVVRVVVRTAPPEHWEIAIEDEGPGISPEIKDQLFRPYFTTKHGGTGIGLAIAHRVVREHGGSLEAENRTGGPREAGGEGQGAVFRIRLPTVSRGVSATIGQK